MGSRVVILEQAVPQLRGATKGLNSLYVAQLLFVLRCLIEVVRQLAVEPKLRACVERLG